MSNDDHVIDLTNEHWDDEIDYAYTSHSGERTVLRRKQCSAGSCQRRCQLEMCSEHLHDILGLEVKESDIAGFGLFATRDITANSKIVTFYGDIAFDGSLRNEYFVWRGGKVYLDCSTNRCSAACANTGGRAMTNNSVLCVYAREAYLKSTKKISAGSEITIPYGRRFAL